MVYLIAIYLYLSNPTVENQTTTPKTESCTGKNCGSRLDHGVLT